MAIGSVEAGPDYASELNELITDFKAGLIARGEIHRAKAALKERYEGKEAKRAA